MYFFPAFFVFVLFSLTKPLMNPHTPAQVQPDDRAGLPRKEHCGLGDRERSSRRKRRRSHHERLWYYHHHGSGLLLDALRTLVPFWGLCTRYQVFITGDRS